MLNEFDVIRDVTTRLSSLGIPYMLTDSLAMNYYSVPRMTRDIDFVIEAGAEAIESIASTFEPDYYVGRSNREKQNAHRAKCLRQLTGMMRILN